MKLIRYQYPTASQAVAQFFAEDFPSFGRFGDWFGDLLEAGGKSRAPVLDWSQSEDAYVLTVELPGVEKGAIRLEVDEDAVSIHAERVVKTNGHTESVTHARTVSLPEGVDREKVTASFEDGVLTLSFPRIEASKARKIEIQ